MVSRTRACQPCRTRRMRCDETSPHCNQCTRAGRVCPGPTEGPLIVDLTAETTARANSSPTCRRRRRPQQSCTGPAFAPLPVNLTFPTAAITYRRRNTNLPQAPSAIISPSELPILTQNFFANFLDYFANPSAGAPGKFWLHRLPWMQTSVTRDGLELAIQAVSVAFYADRADQPMYLHGSRAIYGQALKTHTTAVARLGADVVPSPQVLCTTLMMAFYEGISATEPEGYLRHLEGAAQIVDLFGPKGCEGGLVNELYFTTRTQMLLVSFLTKKRSLFANKSYMDVPYGTQEKPVYERLMDAVTLLVEQYNHPSIQTRDENSAIHSVLTTTDGITDNHTDFATGDETITSDLVLEPESTVNPHSDLAPPAEATASQFILADTDQTINNLWQEFESQFLSERPIRWSQESGSCIYPNAFIAYITSYFDLARILSSLVFLRNQTHQEEQQSSLNSKFFPHHTIKQASSSILACAQYLETQNLGCAFVRIVLPLLVVGLHGVDRLQRKGALEVLERWEGNGTVSGLAGLAARKIKETAV